MKTHTTKGAKILEQVVELHDVIPIVRSHHERWVRVRISAWVGLDPWLARIVAVAMLSTRSHLGSAVPQRNATDQAFAEVEKNKGKQFDPEIAEKFLRIRSTRRARDAGRNPQAGNAQVDSPHRALTRPSLSQSNARENKKL